MLVEFDKFDMAEKPVLTLAYPQRTELGQLGAYSDLSYDAELRSYSTISFKYSYYCNDGKKSAFYDELCAQMLIKVGGTEKGIGEFIVTACEEESDGAERYKQITANSAEYQLCHRKINLLNGTYKFYDTVNKEETLLGVLIEKYLPTWSIGNVSTDLMGKSRTFDVPDSTLYDFLMNDVSEAYECVFVFDTIKREINVYNIEDSRLIHDSDIYIGYNNFLKSEKVEEISEELVTVMSCYGGDGVNIASVNPTGTIYLYNFDHFKPMMSKGLQDALAAWEEKYKEYVVPCSYDSKGSYIKDTGGKYSNLLRRLKEENRVLIGLQTDLRDLETEKLKYEDLQAAQIAGGIASSTETGNKAAYEETVENLNNVLIAITAKEAEITTQQDIIKTIKDGMSAVNHELSFKAEAGTFFGAKNLEELEYFKYESTHQDDNYIITDAMDLVEQQDMIQQLYDSCINIMDKAAHPTYNITADSVNFLFIEKLAPYIDRIYDSSKPETLKQLLGTRFNLEIAEDEWIDPVLLKFHVNFDDPTDFSMEFSNKYRLHNALWTYSDLIGEAVATSGSMSFDYSSVKNWATHKDEMLDFINGNFDVSKNRLVNNSESNSFLIDNTGIRGSSKNADGTDSKKGIWITADTLAFTDDNWQTVKTALGLVGNTETYGLNAELLIGKAIFGSNLMISNEANTMTMDNRGLIIQSNSGTISLIPNKNLEGENDNPGGISIINNKGTNVFQVNMDGELVLQSINAKSGKIGGFAITTERINNTDVAVLKSTESTNNPRIVLRSNGTAKIGMMEIKANTTIFDGEIYADNIAYNAKNGYGGSLSGSAITGGSITGSKITSDGVNGIGTSQINTSAVTYSKLNNDVVTEFNKIYATEAKVKSLIAENAIIQKLSIGSNGYLQCNSSITLNSTTAGMYVYKPNENNVLGNLGMVLLKPIRIAINGTAYAILGSVIT